MLLTVPPLLWAGNVVLGRVVRNDIPPFTLNLVRWLLAFLILLPLAHWVLRRGSGGMWPHWRRFALLGLLGIGLYNTLQYLALHTSSGLNVALVGSSGPLWMLAVGALFFRTPVSRHQLFGAVLSVIGVCVVLSRGQWSELLALRLVAGDLFMLVATACWAGYSWLLATSALGSEPSQGETNRRAQHAALAGPPTGHSQGERTGSAIPAAIRNGWAAFLLAQITMGLLWSSLFTAGEWALTDAHIRWSAQLVAACIFIAVGPAVLAYRCWGLGVQRAGPAMAGFFANLTPLFVAMLSAAFLGETPQLYHLLAFALIVGGIVVSARR